LLTDLPALPVADPAPAGQAQVSRRESGASAAAGMLGVLAVVAFIAVLSRTGYGFVGGWGFIIPVLIVWRLLGRRHHDD
jgi:hypothetical protein